MVVVAARKEVRLKLKGGREQESSETWTLKPSRYKSSKRASQ